MCDSKVHLKGKVVVVTGGSSGVGYETAAKLAKKGARVIIASRNKAKLEKARDEIRNETGNTNVDYRAVDLASLRSVREFAEAIKLEEKIDVLINNAGAIGLPDARTEDGLHVMMQVNYFGSFLLTYLLLPLLITAAPSRIINLTSASMYIGQIDFDHLNDIGHWSTISLLANSKLADSLFTVELAKRINGSGVTANSYDPFLVPDTGILENIPSAFGYVGNIFARIIGRSKSDVAGDLVYLASEPSLEGATGRHYKFCGEWFNTWLANDEELTSKLWEISKELVKITPDEEFKIDV